jgi:hypothetical protein
VPVSSRSTTSANQAICFLLALHQLYNAFFEILSSRFGHPLFPSQTLSFWAMGFGLRLWLPCCLFNVLNACFPSLATRE